MPPKAIFPIFFYVFLVGGEAALAADLITAWKPSGEAARAADLITACSFPNRNLRGQGLFWLHCESWQIQMFASYLEGCGAPQTRGFFFYTLIIIRVTYKTKDAILYDGWHGMRVLGCHVKHAQTSVIPMLFIQLVFILVAFHECEDLGFCLPPAQAELAQKRLWLVNRDVQGGCIRNRLEQQLETLCNSGWLC